MRKILFLLAVALTPLECVAWQDPVLIIVGMSEEARIAEGGGATVVVSAGNAGLLRSRLAALRSRRFRTVVSFGVAGGLTPAARVGDVYLASTVVAGGSRWTATSALADVTAEQRLRGLGVAVKRGILAGADGLSAVSPEARHAIAARSGAEIVDNESHIAAAEAAARGIPFTAVRAVLDPDSFVLPPAALIPLLPDGRANMLAITGSVLQQPWQVQPLQTLAYYQRIAFDALRRCRSALAI